MTRRRDRNRELQEELRTHIEMATRDRIERGEDPASAAAAARREFGNVAQVQEVTREMWGWTRLERLGQDLRYAVRLLRRAPAFSFVSIVSLALGIGANTAIFQVIDALRLRSLPVARPYELVEITPANMDGARGNFSSWRQSVSNPIWEQVRDHQEAFSGTLAYGATSFNLATGGEARSARGLFVSGGFFDTLEIRPEAGRLLSAADDRRGCVPRAVLSHAFWRREFGGSRSAIGGTVTLNARPVEIVGVAPASFFGLEVGRSFDVAVPICADAVISDRAGRLDSGTDWWLIVMGRLKPGLTIDQASAHLNALSSGIFQTTLKPNYPPVSVSKYLAMKLHALPAPTGVSYLREVYESALWLLLALAALVLLIACANLANLMLARASAREHEIAIRLGLGASRGRVVRQLLTESTVLSTVGAIGGFLLARVLGDTLVGFVDGDAHEIVLSLALDWRMVAFTVGLAAGTCLLFGLTPALRATRLGPSAVMKNAGRGLTTTRHGAALRRALVVTQVAISVVMVFGALLFTRTLHNLSSVDPGFTRDVVIADVDYRRVAIAPEQRTAYRQSILDRLRAVPGIEAAATTAIVPVSGDAWGNDVTLHTAAGPKVVNVRFNRVSQGYFDTFHVPVRMGRDFDVTKDTTSAPRVAIVNQTLAAMFEGGNAIGARFVQEATPSSPPTEYEVVGVVTDSKYLESPRGSGAGRVSGRDAGDGSRRRDDDRGPRTSRTEGDDRIDRPVDARARSQHRRLVPDARHVHRPHADSRATDGHPLVVLRLDRRRPRRRRPLRGDCLHGHAPDERNRRAHGARGVAEERDRDGAARGRRARGNRTGDWDHPGAGERQVRRDVPVRPEAAGRAVDGARGAGARDCRAARQLSPRSRGLTDRAHCRPARGIARQGSVGPRTGRVESMPAGGAEPEGLQELL